MTLTKRLSKEQFTELSSLIYNTCGIQLPEAKQVLLEARLAKRLKVNEMNTMDEYLNMVFKNKKVIHPEEFTSLIDVVTTNKTDFYREPAHYSIMTGTVLPELLADRKKLEMWSAGCSSGEEPYTLAMVMEEYIRNHEHLNYRITATDLSTEVLRTANRGIYEEKKLGDMSAELKSRYFLRSKNREEALVKVNQKIRSRVRFGRLNFMDDDYHMDTKFDIIFCRNVIIYFDRETQKKVLAKLIRQLKTGGYLFIGHSESLHHMQLPVQQVAPTVFKK